MILRFAKDEWGDAYMMTPDGEIRTGYDITELRSPHHEGMMMEYYEDFTTGEEALEDRFLQSGGILWRLIWDSDYPQLTIRYDNEWHDFLEVRRIVHTYTAELKRVARDPEFTVYVSDTGSIQRQSPHMYRGMEYFRA